MDSFYFVINEIMLFYQDIALSITILACFVRKHMFA